ncbi:MAG: GlxA family transcriptional regulator, partial [Moritella sp.]|uniref:GlxA family transcriptional regulator n=1 Tax=Moritella sp. TaxID=78556 RepID=UPI001DD2F505
VYFKAMSLFAPNQNCLKVSILLLPESSLMSLACSLDTMRAANRIAKKPRFSWQILSIDGLPVELSCGQTILPDAAFNSQHRGDLLICIAAFHHQQHMPSKQLLLFKQRARPYRYLGAVESGSWILARAGFLNGLQATTHWEDLEDFSNQFSTIKVQPDRYVIDGGIFTTGGASPTFDLFLQLIRSRFGHTLALAVASVFIYDGNHRAHTPQPIVTLGLLQGQSPSISAAIKLMQAHIDEPVAISQIAAELSLSRRTLEKQFRAQLGISPLQYYKSMRLQIAKKLVLDSHNSMQEIALRTGFSSLAVFSREFKLTFNHSPSQFRKQAH